MKLTGELKDKVFTAGTKEEKKELIAQAGMELTDEELEDVAGGKGTHIAQVVNKRNMICPICGNPLGKNDVCNSLICQDINRYRV